MCVDEPREDFLSDSGFAGYQHRNIRIGNLLCDFFDAKNSRVRGQHVALLHVLVEPAHLLEQHVAIVVGQAFGRDRLADLDVDRARVDERAAPRPHGAAAPDGAGNNRGARRDCQVKAALLELANAAITGPSAFGCQVDTHAIAEQLCRVLDRLDGTCVVRAIDFDELATRNGRIIAAEAYAVHRAYIEDSSLPIDPWVRRRTIGGKAISAADYIDELARQKHASREFASWMTGRDAILTPTLPVTATPVADVDESKTPYAAFTRAAN